MMLRKGIVVATHPEDHSVDLVMTDDGARLVGVQILSPNGSTRTGMVDLPEVVEKPNKWDVSEPTGQDLEAIVGYVGGFPVVMGFLYPQISQMTFNDPKRKLVRHQSDVYYTVDGRGNVEFHHPSGTYVRIAESPEHENLQGQNTDANLAIDRNTDKKVHVHVRMAGGVASIDITPGGAITVLSSSTIDMRADGDITIESGTHIKMDAPRIDLNE